MLMSAVSAEENITLDATDSTSNYLELDSDQDYGENPILEDNIIDDEKNISEEDAEPDICSGSLNGHDAYSANAGPAHATKTSFDKGIAFHKSASCPRYEKSNGADDTVNERIVGGMFSNSQLSDDLGIEAYDIFRNDVRSEEEFSAETYFNYRKCFDYLKLDSLNNFLEENKIEDVFNSNIPSIDFNTIDYLKYDLINFMGIGVKYADFHVEKLINLNVFLDIFDKIMNSPPNNDVMANISLPNSTPTLRNHKYYSNFSDYGLYQDADSIINSYDLNNETELFIESDSNISDIQIIRVNMTVINQTSDVYINSYDNAKSDLQSSGNCDCCRDTYIDETVEIQSFKFNQQINCLPNNISEDIPHVFYHMIGCECTSTGFTKQHNSYDELPEVSEFDTITSTEEDNHDNFLFNKFNVNAPFILENPSVFALFGVIKITIP